MKRKSNSHNWDGDELGEGDRNFGHLAYAVDDIYATCARLAEHGVVINRPPEMVGWRSFAHLTTFLLSYSKR